MNFRTLGLLLLTSVPASADEHWFHHEHVLGTSMDLCVNADSQPHAKQAERDALEEIDRLNAILSSYDAGSELSRFVALPKDRDVAISPELFEVLQSCGEWNHASRGAFNPAIEHCSQLWRDADRNDRRPSSEAIRSAVRLVRQQHWRLNAATGTGRRLTDAPLSVNAIAKGYILDRVANLVLTQSVGVTGVMLNIGGDIRAIGSMEIMVGIGNPTQDAIGGELLTHIPLADRAVATSGSSERFIEVEGTRYSHILDPRTGEPAGHVTSASVVAPTATIADALATICSVLSVRESISLVNSIAGADCLLVSADGSEIRSNNWPQEKDKKPSDKPGQKKKDDKPAEKKKTTKPKLPPTGHEMRVDFEIARPPNSRRYRRPYVAVWIEDKDKFPVKTLSLFLMQRNPGPRWYRDVRRWYSDEQLRRIVDDKKDMIKAVSKPTRNPGKYNVIWDGRDDDGKILKPGKYTLLIESAREHGSYQLIKQEFEFGKALKKKLRGNVEISAASMTYTVKGTKTLKK